MESLLNKLSKIQATINVAKNQLNKFGNYNFRSCEDILQALQPYCKELNVVVLLSDEIKELMNGWVYVEATATIKDCESQEEISVKAQAGIQERKGMDLSQTFGASSSYARKYALNGLFKLDDNKDADTDAFTKIIKKENAENSSVESVESEIVKPNNKKPKLAEKMANKTEGEILVEVNKVDDLELPFEEESIEALNELHDTIASLNFKLGKDTTKCYEYFCKEFKFKSADELNKKQLEYIIGRLTKANGGN